MVLWFKQQKTILEPHTSGLYAQQNKAATPPAAVTSKAERKWVILITSQESSLESYYLSHKALWAALRGGSRPHPPVLNALSRAQTDMCVLNMISPNPEVTDGHVWEAGTRRVQWRVAARYLKKTESCRCRGTGARLSRGSGNGEGPGVTLSPSADTGTGTGGCGTARCHGAPRRWKAVHAGRYGTRRSPSPEERQAAALCPQDYGNQQWGNQSTAEERKRFPWSDSGLTLSFISPEI